MSAERERPRVRAGLSLLPAEDLRRAIEPLLASGRVDAIEWSVDFGFGVELPPWVREVLDTYEKRGALYAHGVELSPMSADASPDQDAWLTELEVACRARRYRHLTEHYGFMTARDFVRGTPLPLPPSSAGLELAKARVRQLERTSGLPVGIENLAFAWSRDDALAQAVFVRRLLEESGAFLLLDVHNLLCQIENYALDPEELLELYPLERTREIHVAGGQLAFPASDAARRPFRRDSHDEAVPDAAFALLRHVLPRCPALEVVILERSDRSVFGAEEAARHREDFETIAAIVRETPASDEGPATARGARDHAVPELRADDLESLAAYQRALLGTLTRAHAPAAVRAELASRAELSHYAGYIAGFEDRALEIGSSMALEWSAPEAPAGSMAAAVFLEPGKPLVLRGLPRVTAGPGQVVLSTRAVGLCGTDAHILSGAFPVPTPIVLGHETVGVVEELGAGVTSLAIGDVVGVSWVQRGCGACRACRAGQVVRCASPRTWVENGGGLSERVVVEASGCTRLPEGLDPELAAPLFCAGHTVMSGYLRARPQPGERVAVLGVGGLGHLAIQVAAALGHEVVALTSHADKVADARALGASLAIACGDAPGAALDAIGGADVVLATTSSYADVGRIGAGLRVGGRVVVMGLGAGALTLDAMDLIQREAELLFAVQGPTADLERVLALARGGKLAPIVESYPVNLVNRALGRLERGRVRYRAVVSFPG
jgi:alcohol dehydrogenase/propanol-preferring alcohol dehydrogenase